MKRPLLAGLLALALSAPTASAQAPSGQMTARTTAYCLNGRTAMGTYVRPGVVAVDPHVIQMGSRLTIEGLDGVYVAEDTGGGVIGNWVDVYFPNCSEAVQWGVQYRNVEWFP